MKKVWIDEGHGGIQPGACSQGYREKDLTLQIGNVLAAELIRQGIEVNRTRTSDIDVGLEERARQANKWKADIFVSIHLNASNGNGFGAETWCSILGGESRRLAEAVNRQLVSLGYKDRKVKWAANSLGKDNLCVIRETSMPAILAEVGFIDNKADMALFDAQKAAQAIAKGICAYFGMGYIAVSPLTLDTKSKTLKPGELYTVLARTFTEPKVSVTGADIIAVQAPRIDARKRGYLIDVRGKKAGFSHITVSNGTTSCQCNFNVKE